MNLSTTNRLTSVFLLAVFFCFSVGIPIVRTLCPMMEMNDGLCPMHEQGCTSEVSFTYQSGNCCAAKIVAERNTIPFVKFEEKKSLSLESLFAILHDESQIAANAHTRFTELIPRCESSPPPLYVLHSSLLI